MDEEIVDRSIYREEPEIRLNRSIKNKMRNECAKDISTSFLEILRMKHPEMTNFGLKVLKTYIEWTDINYYITADYGNIFMEMTNDMELRAATCEVLSEICLKGMDSLSKLNMLKDLKFVELISSLRFDSSMDIVFARSVADLCNSVAMQLLETGRNTRESHPNESITAFQMFNPYNLY
eukprot:CAMPEP_0117418684 /NCGR_PEP_ID=MMETSP0758-20121206/400_1 /TAXON_ID=63605 /ORGANISM="Percolomonas cosmopolitus, Strain AE-1 (ATCC 50343)" /LENGTH=178 /DNA_ID=CAMNT_0005199303 /DNA_START=453 /DNA_END=990 /DNA_ORIENTATION=+